MKHTHLLRLVLICGALALPLSVWAQSVPVLLAVHKGFKSRSGPANVDRLVTEIGTRGVFPNNTPALLGIACHVPNVSTELRADFDDSDVLSEAERLVKLKDIPKESLDKYRKIVSKRRDPSDPKSKVLDYETADINIWSIYSADREVLNIVKSVALRKAGVLKGDSRLKEAQSSLLPIVFILLPTIGLFDENEANSAFAALPENVTTGQTYRDVMTLTPDDNLMALSLGSLTLKPNQALSGFSIVLYHETGHYFGVWHTFVGDSDPTDSDKVVSAAAKRIRDSDNCGRSRPYTVGPIKDVDFALSRNAVGDTKPTWYGNATLSETCMSVYKDHPAGDYPDPSKNLMNYEDGSKYGRDENAALALTKNQLSVVTKELARLKKLGRPQNLCTP